MKKVAILAGLLIILTALYYIFEKPSDGKKKQETVDFIPGFDRTKVVTVQVKSPDKGETLLKNDNSVWKVIVKDKTYEADAAAMNDLVDSVVKIKSETIASKNPKNFDSFEVTEGKGIEVKIDDGAGKNLAHFFVGKNGPDIFSTYIRAKDSNTVILVPGILKNVFDKELKDWRDKTVFKLNKDDIVEYTIEGDMTLAMKKDEKGSWQVLKPEAFAPKKDAAEKVVANFTGVKAVDFPEGKLTEFGLDKPKRTITALFKDGTKEALILGKDKNAYQYFVKPKSRDAVYVIEKYELESLCPTLDKLKEQEKKEAQQSDNATK